MREVIANIIEYDSDAIAEAVDFATTVLEPRVQLVIRDDGTVKSICLIHDISEMYLKNNAFRTEVDTKLEERE